MSVPSWILVVVPVAAVFFLAGLFYGHSSAEVQLNNSFATSDSVALLAENGSILAELPAGLIVHSLHDPLAKESTRYVLIFRLHATSKYVKLIEAPKKRKGDWRSYPAAGAKD